MSRNKQVVLNLIVVVALFVSLVGVLPVSGGVAVDVPSRTATVTSPIQPISQVAPKAVRQPGQLEETKDVKNLSNDPVVYMIRLADPALAAYTGGITGLTATSPQMTGERKLNVSSVAARSYMAYLGSKHAQAIAAAEQALKRSLKVVYEYFTANNGFAAYLTPAEADEVAKLPGVIYVERDAESQLQTDVGPTWIGANTIWDGSATGTATKGEGVIVGVIDTGINHASPSFAAIGGDGYHVTNPWGAGNYVGYCVANPSFCNDKLIGAWGYPSVNGGNPEDADGHGSHTASTAAGNVVTATLTSTSGAVFTRTISGVAPHANVVMYAACCTNSALSAAIDQVITDSVDAVNYSIGSTSASDPWSTFDSVGFLNARNAGIFVANSAGNSGPGVATLGSPSGAPWLTAVAASTANRQFLSSVISPTGGLITNTPPVLNGRGMSNGLSPHPIVYAGAAPYNDPLCQISTADGVFNGKIVVCDRGTNGRVEKGQNVAARGAAGMIMVEVGPDGPGFFTTDSEQPIPAVYLTRGDGDLLKAWLATGSGHQVGISPTVMDINNSYADVMASFSSRGENTSVADVIAPSVAAPGVATFAAYKTPEGFAVIQGTSMASPHVAGAAALLVALHPNWRPAEIQSALMSTAHTGVVKEDGVTPADPFDMGSGRIDLLGASQAGIVLNETNAHYLAANPGTGGDPKTLNLASFGNAQCLSTCSWTRTLSSTMNSAVTWTSSVTSAAGITLTVTPISFTLPAHGSKIITVTADVSALPNDVWAFGSVMLTPDVTNTVAAHFPVAVKPTSGVLPDLVTIDTSRDAGSQAVAGVQSIAATNLTLKSFGLTPATLTHRSIPQDSTPSEVYDNLNDPGLFYITMTVPAGAKRFVAEITDSTAQDLDLYVHLDANHDGLPQESEQVCVSASSAVLEYCNVNNPAPGTYIVLVQNWEASAAITDTVTLATAVVTDSDAGNLTVTGPTSVGQLVPYNLSVAWNAPAMVAGDRWYGAFSLGTTPATAGNIGTIPVDIVRHPDDVSKMVSKSVVNRGDTITYTITILPNVTPVDLAYMLTDTIPAGLTYVPGSVTATAGVASVTGNQLTWSGTMGAQFRHYAMTTSSTDPNCVMPLANSGAYVNLQPYGILPQPTVSGDTKWYTAFSTGAQFNYWGANYTGLSFTDDGMAFFGSTPGSTPWINQDIPNAADPNNLMAMMWRDWEIVYATAPISRGVSLATLGGTGAGGGALVEYDDVQLYHNPSQTMDYEVLAWRTPDDTPGSPEIIFAFDNISMTHPLTVGTIGLENADGTAGVKYAYNDAALNTITNGMAICFDWYLPSAEPVTITYRATVDQAVADGTVLTNQVLHNTDNPGSVVAMAEVSVMVPNRIYLPLIRR
ncbi:MAG TPA: S8 family serine peptidase [Anaerolineae bacterium]|nr:S8 family serine peptidase [Anaerolineae bacterium]